MSTKTYPFLFLILVLPLAGCAPQPAATPAIETPTEDVIVTPAEPVDLSVFAAASLTAAFEEIGQSFEAAYPGVTVVFNFAGSQ